MTRARRSAAGVALAAGIALAAAVALSACTAGTPAPTPAVTPTPSADGVGVVDLGVGDCFDEPSAGGTISEVETTPCDEPHDLEVFASWLLDLEAFPEQADIDALGWDGCRGAFDAFVGVAYADSALDYVSLAPTSETWAAGDREVLCIVFDPAGPVTGSLRGAAR